jgi:hypothetical protein
MEKQKSGRVAVLVQLPTRTAAFLDAEVAKVEKRYGVKSGRAVILRGLADALEAVRFPVAQAGPSAFHLRDATIKALNAQKSAAEEKN